jgi:hypothetical protein
MTVLGRRNYWPLLALFAPSVGHFLCPTPFVAETLKLGRTLSDGKTPGRH